MTTHTEGRPAGNRTAWNLSDEDSPILPFNVPILGRVRIHLCEQYDAEPAVTTMDDLHRLTRRMQEAVYVPRGADVVIEVSPRQMPPSFGVQFIRENGQHLGSITIESSDGDTVGRWCRALRGDEGAL